MKLKETVSGNSRYMSAKLGWGEKFDFKEIEILIAGAIPALIPPEAVQGKKSNVIRYNIASYSTLRFYLTCILSREQFAALLLQCVDVFRQLQRIYLNYKNLVLDFDQIYVLLADRTLHFLYLPLLESKREASIPDFFRKLLQSAGRSTFEQVSFLDGCLAWLNRPTPFSLEAFEEFIQGGTNRRPAPAGAPVGAPVQAAAPRAAEVRTYHPPVAWTPPAAEMNATSVLGAVPQNLGGTVLLSDNPQQPAQPRPRFYLTRTKTGERIEINTSPFLVGTESGSVNYLVTGNAAVSRKHAQFLIQNGECQIADQKSTNKTYVNDCALTPFVPRKLADGDKIRLGNEEFLFSQEG